MISGKKSRLGEQPPRDLSGLSSAEIAELVHELQVHQTELELQNESLRAAQSELEASRDEQTRLLYELGPLAYLTLDPAGHILEANQTAARLLQSSRDGLHGRSLSDFVAEGDQDLWFLHRRELAQTSVERAFPLRLQHLDGRILHTEVAARSAGPRGERPELIRLALVDVSDREQAKRERLEASTLAARVEQRERRKLAEELHDDVGQTLSLASMRLSALAAATSPEETGALVAELSSLIADAGQKVSSLSFQLSPTILYDVGLVAAAQWLAEEMRRTYGLRVEVAPAAEIDELDETTRAALFRAIREFLVNVAKHSRAELAEVRIWREDPFALVDVEDRGVGFDPASVQRGFGLLSVRERIEQLGGRLELRTVPGDGTHVRIRVPLRAGGEREGGATR
jgi:PAS domain S-box-containing protein